MGRDWAAVAEARRGHWARVLDERGAAFLLRVADELREHAGRFERGDREARRARDFADLVELKRKIDAARACSR
jgi:hypothetical protein